MRGSAVANGERRIGRHHSPLSSAPSHAAVGHAAGNLCRRVLAIAFPLLLAASSGCSSLATIPDDWFREEPEFLTPTRVIPVWTDTVLHQAGKQGTRGCGGRIMFYRGDSKRAIRVDGSLIVYAWDETQSADRQKPDRKFVFRADDLQRHYSESKIGDSYSFWLPWDTVGGEQTQLTLIARFIDRNGGEVTSAPARVILPGIVSPPEAAAGDAAESSVSAVEPEDVEPADRVSPTSIRRASWNPAEPPRQERPDERPATAHGITSTDIPLTRGFLERNLQRRPRRGYSGDALLSEEAEPAAAEAPIPHPHTGHSARLTPEPPARDVSAKLPGTHGPRDAETVPLAESNGRQSLVTPPPADHSLRFQHRVQTSRAAQRSVGRALTERYQSEPRIAPWERD